MIIELTTLEDYFIEKAKKLPGCTNDTQAYIISTFTKYKDTTSDLSKKSITIEFSKAKFEHSFHKYNEIGDWLLFTKSVFPESLKHASEEYYSSLAQISYHKCYILTNRSWKVFAELADLFPQIINHLHASLMPDALLSPQEKL